MVIFDLKHNNNLDAVDSRGVFQFYPMVNLWKDIRIASDAGLTTIHLSSAPIRVSQIASEAFGLNFSNELEQPPLSYDFRTCYGDFYGVNAHYQYDEAQTISAIKSYADLSTGDNENSRGVTV